jgi:hypothetical protein
MHWESSILFAARVKLSLILKLSFIGEILSAIKTENA